MHPLNLSAVTDTVPFSDGSLGSMAYGMKRIGFQEKPDHTRWSGMHTPIVIDPHHLSHPWMCSCTVPSKL